MHEWISLSISIILKTNSFKLDSLLLVKRETISSWDSDAHDPPTDPSNLEMDSSLLEDHLLSCRNPSCMGCSFAVSFDHCFSLRIIFFGHASSCDLLRTRTFDHRELKGKETVHLFACESEWHNLFLWCFFSEIDYVESSWTWCSRMGWPRTEKHQSISFDSESKSRSLCRTPRPFVLRAIGSSNFNCGSYSSISQWVIKGKSIFKIFLSKLMESRWKIVFLEFTLHCEVSRQSSSSVHLK